VASTQKKITIAATGQVEVPVGPMTSVADVPNLYVLVANLLIQMWRERGTMSSDV